jgi:hypothetical protein
VEDKIFNKLMLYRLLFTGEKDAHPDDCTDVVREASQNYKLFNG